MIAPKKKRKKKFIKMKRVHLIMNSYQMRRQNGRCAYCNRPFFESVHTDQITRDHKIPLSKGGFKKGYNVVFACQPCNALKADMLYDDFIKQYPRGILTKPKS